MLDPPPADDDELTLGGRVAWRWYVVAGVLVALAVVIVTVDRNAGQPKPTPTATPTAAAPLPVGPVGLAGARPLQLTREPAIDVVTAAGRRVWVLQTGHLTLSRPGSAPMARVALPLGGDEVSSARLVPDLPADRIWVVVLGRNPAHIVEFNATTLVPLRALYWSRPIYSAAGLRHHLYLASQNGVGDLAAGKTQVRLIDWGWRGIPALAADESRDRLIVADGGSPTRLWTLRPGTPPRRAAVTLPYVKVSLAVTGSGAIWAAGYRHEGAALQRLDSRTLRPVVSATVTDELGPGARIVAAGSRSVWVRGAGPDDPQLWCVDAANGVIRQTLTAGGNVASTGANAVIATQGKAWTLPLNGCHG